MFLREIDDIVTNKKIDDSIYIHEIIPDKKDYDPQVDKRKKN